MNDPIKVFRIGYCSAAVFANTAVGADGEERTFLSATLQRRYKRSGTWETANSYTLGEIANALRALHLAQDFIEQQEACRDVQTTDAERF